MMHGSTNVKQKSGFDYYHRNVCKGLSLLESYVVLNGG